MTLPDVLRPASDYFNFYTLMKAIGILILAPSVLPVIVLRRRVVQGLMAWALKE